MYQNKSMNRAKASVRSFTRRHSEMYSGLSMAVVLICTVLYSAMPAQAQTSGVAEVEYVRGIALAQQANAAPRIMGKGSVLAEGDRISTSDGSLAIVKMQDGTRMTVRPSSELVLAQFKYDAKSTDNAMVLNLLRGGLRAITGLINKNGAGTARIQTNTATIGIRGTDFDARLCRADCAAEGARVAQAPRPNAVQASARLRAVRGQLDAVNTAGERRRLSDGAALYPGETLETSANSEGVLLFRDQTKVRLAQSSRMRIDEFVYFSSSVADARFAVSLLRGSMRAVTGLIGQGAPRNVSFRTNAAAVNIRGTELGIDCTGTCAGETEIGSQVGTRIFAYSGQVAVQWAPPGVNPLPEMLHSSNQGSFLVTNSTTPVLITQPSSSQPSSPSDVPFIAALFDGRDHSDQQEGLYVNVRDGHIELVTEGQEILHLGRGETGFTAPNAGTYRPVNVPIFIDFDRVPLPNSRNPVIGDLLGSSGIRPNTAPICR